MQIKTRVTALSDWSQEVNQCHSAMWGHGKVHSQLLGERATFCAW